VLDVFRSGEDIYMHTARTMNLDDRFIGKVATLALGYQGGVGAFQNMAKIYGLKMSDTEAKVIVDKWRGANHWALTFWKQCDRASKEAVRNPGTIYPAGRLRYWATKDTLVCDLPGGHTIQYPLAKLEQEKDPKFGSREVIGYAKASLTPAADAEEWPRHTLYSGILAENSCQAVAANILKASLRELDDVVAHVHDEIVLEVPEDEADEAAEDLQIVMETPPDWAEGLPLKAVPVIMKRYGK
jgi:DNA polymerase